MTRRANLAVAALTGLACLALTQVAQAQPAAVDQFKNMDCRLWDIDFEPKSKRVGDRIREFMVGIKCKGTPRVDLTVAYVPPHGDDQVIGKRFGAQIIERCSGFSCPAVNSAAEINSVRATVEAQGFELKVGCYRATVVVNDKTESIKRCAVPTQIELGNINVGEPEPHPQTKPQAPVIVKAVPGKR